MSITAQTRRDAFEAVDVATMEKRVLTILLAYGPQTSGEIMARMGTSNPNNVRPRLTGLKKKGLARPVDRRPNRSGRSEAVWEAIEKESRPGGNDTEGGKGKRTAKNIPEENGYVKI